MVTNTAAGVTGMLTTLLKVAIRHPASLTVSLFLFTQNEADLQHLLDHYRAPDN